MYRGLLIALALLPLAALAGETSPALTGDLRVHDPSIIVVDGQWASFHTGDESGRYRGAIRLKTSPDGVAWTDAGAIGKGVPAWTQDVLGYASRNIWAPSVSRHGDTLYLYYSVSSFGINVSTIGLMTNTAFNPAAPGEGWVDQGMVLRSVYHDPFNAIDPFRIDTADGRAWLSFGSFWSGIKMRELDPGTGKLMAGDTPQYDLASRGGGAIEAASIVEHDGKFVLFVSFDACCRGINSTYRIMVGRADAVTGPYLDKDGTPMMEGGGSELQSRAGRFIGPGGQEPVVGSPVPTLAYHYYDGDERGISKLQLVPIQWDRDGWPQLALPPQ